MCSVLAMFAFALAGGLGGGIGWLSMLLSSASSAAGAGFVGFTGVETPPKIPPGLMPGAKKVLQMCDSAPPETTQDLSVRNYCSIMHADWVRHCLQAHAHRFPFR